MFGKDKPTAEVMKKEFEAAPPSSIEDHVEKPESVKAKGTPTALYAHIPMLIIREPKETDVDAIYQLGQSIPELASEDDEEFLSKDGVEHFARYYQSNCLVAELEGKLVGFVIIEKEGYDSTCITFLGVAPEYRNEGIGAFLLSQMESKVKTKGFYLFATSSSAVDYFEKKGYHKGKTMTYMGKDVVPD